MITDQPVIDNERIVGYIAQAAERIMKASVICRQFWLAALLLVAGIFQSAQHVSANEAISVTVRNDLSDPVTVFFEGDHKRVAQGDPLQPLVSPFLYDLAIGSMEMFLIL